MTPAINTNYDPGQIHSLMMIFVWLGLVIVLILAALVFIGIILRLISYFRSYKQDSIVLELTPPAFTDKTPLATLELFAVIHGIQSTRPWMSKLLRQNVILAFEVASSRQNGIRYFVRLAKTDKQLVTQSFQAYMPDGKIKVVDDYLKPIIDSKQSRTQLYKLAGHFAHPLAAHDSLPQNDPIAYLTSSMTQLEADEHVALQLVVSPAIIASAHKIDRKIRRGENAGASIGKRLTIRSPLHLLIAIIKLPFIIFTSVAYALFYDDLPDSMKSTRPVAYNPHISPAEQELVDRMHDKLTQQLFYVDIRTVVSSPSKQRRKERSKAIRSSLASFSVPKYQSLKSKPALAGKLTALHRTLVLKYRLPSLIHGNSSILAASELAAIFHFPHSQSARTENVVKSLSRTLPAPIAIKNNPKFDVVLGQNVHQGVATLIGLTQAERERHSYIIGGTGNGKTTMLMYGIVQDIHAGKGIAVVDPHGDLAKTVLEHIPETRMKDVIYFDPDDVDYPIGVNLLELPHGLKGSALESEKDRITESVISVFRKVFSDDDTGGHRIEYILRNTIQTALTLKDSTIFTVFELLTNDDYRKKVTNDLPAGTLKNFWKNELGKAGNMQRVKMSQGVTSKIGRFEFSVATKRVMGQPKSTIDFDDILSSGKILICNFSKGRLGEDTSALFGTAILAKLQVAANRRDRLPQAKRTPFYLYVDEFQNFATMPFVQMLSEARKYKLFLTMAEQSTAQQEEQRMVNIILANVGTVVCFRTGSPIDERLVLPLFQPFIEAGEIANLPSFSFYVRIAALQPQEPLSGETLLLEEKGSEKVSKQVRALSRKHYAKKYKDENTKKVMSKKPETQLKLKTPEPEVDQPLDV